MAYLGRKLTSRVVEDSGLLAQAPSTFATLVADAVASEASEEASQVPVEGPA